MQKARGDSRTIDRNLPETLTAHRIVADKWEEFHHGRVRCPSLPHSLPLTVCASE